MWVQAPPKVFVGSVLLRYGPTLAPERLRSSQPEGLVPWCQRYDWSDKRTDDDKRTVKEGKGCERRERRSGTRMDRLLMMIYIYDIYIKFHIYIYVIYICQISLTLEVRI